MRVDEEEDVDLDGGRSRRGCSSPSHAVDDARRLVLEDYNKGVLVPAVIRGGDRRGQRARDPDRRRSEVPEFLRSIVARRSSSRIAASWRPRSAPAVDLEHPDALPATFAALGVEHLLLTLGERGMVLVSADGEIERVPTVAREVYDVVGAGDTVTAYLATMLGGGRDAGSRRRSSPTSRPASRSASWAPRACRAEEVLDYVDTHVLHV